VKNIRKRYKALSVLDLRGYFALQLSIEKEASYIVTVISLTKPNPESHPSDHI
jgi:hypothetical protein